MRAASSRECDLPVCCDSGLHDVRTRCEHDPGHARPRAGHCSAFYRKCHKTIRVAIAVAGELN